MKIKKISSVVTTGGSIYLEDIGEGDGKTQWVGDGCAMYQLGNVPYLEKSNIFPLFDIDKKKLDKISCFHNSIYPDFKRLVADNCQQEERVKETQVAVRLSGRTITALAPERSMPFLINAKYLNPLSDIEQRSLWLRHTEGREYIVAKDGMFTVAIILPMKSSVIDDTVVCVLEQMAREARRVRGNEIYSETTLDGQVSLIDYEENEEE